MSSMLKKLLHIAVESDKASKEGEDTFDKAVSANAASDGNDPSATAAVDFDSEIAKLRGTQEDPPTDAGSGEQPPTDPSEGAGAKAPGEEGADGNEDNGGKEEPTNVSSEGSNEQDQEVPEAEEGEVATPVTEDDPESKTEAATEALTRVCKCLEHLEHVRQFSVLNPIMHAAIESEIQAAVESVGISIARPATEGMFDPDTKLGAAKDYAVTAIKKILELLRKLWDSSKKYIADYTRAFLASFGVYKRDLTGLQARFDKIKFSPDNIKTMSFDLKALSNNAPILTPDTMLRSANVARTLASNTATVCASADDVMSKSLALMGTTQDPAAFEFPSIVRNFKVFNGTTSIASAGELVIEDNSFSKNANGGYNFSISGIPGGHGINWTFEALHRITGWDKVAQTMMKYDFTHSPDVKMDNTQIEISNSRENILAVLEAAKDVKFSTHIAKCLDVITSKRQLIERVITAALNQFAKGPNQQTQEAARALSIAANAYERVYVRPVYFAVKLASAVDTELLSVVKTLIATYDDKPKEQV